MARYPVGRLAGKAVVTDRGLALGELVDIVIDELSGKAVKLVIREARGAGEALTQKLERDRRGLVMLPYSTVKYIREMIVVDERLLRVYIATQSPAERF
ncbi:MAG: hypothetical protein DRO06_04115 [Thermoproteota archaeon]|nr:MAG: hypothetical protein DRO06_04115 [Candidatus Korarchaeota archaeon]